MCAFGSFPRLGQFSAIISIHNLSVPFSLSSAFETPSILLTYSSRVRSFSENIFIKKKKERNLSSVLTSTWIILPLNSCSLCSIWSPLPVLCNSSFISFTEFFSTRISVYLCSRAFIILETVLMFIIFIPQLTEVSLGSFLVACWASSWHYFEFSTCLITLLHDIKLVHG